MNDKEIIEKYIELGSIWKVGDFFGIKGQVVHGILKKNGIKMKNPKFSESEKILLIELYDQYASSHRLNELSAIFGRTKNFLCRKAKELGLTNSSRKYNLSGEQKAKLSNAAYYRIQKYGHPKGMYGKHHSESFKTKMSERIRKTWKDNPSIFMTDKRRRVISQKMSEMQRSGILGVRSRTYITRAIFGNDKYTFKSNWEFNIALLLEYLKMIGDIDYWKYEFDVFNFPDNEYFILSYTTDFTIYKNDEKHIIELKGWFDERSRKKIELVNRFFPEEKVEVWDENEYYRLQKEYKDKISLWDYRKTIKNDNLCVKVVAEKFIDKGNPRVEFKIVTID